MNYEILPVYWTDSVRSLTTAASLSDK
jgi:hypothetical protein